MNESEAMTIDMLKEAVEVIKALSPKSAPDGLFLLKGASGLKIIKSSTLQSDTIIVSERLFNLIHEASS